MASAGIILFSGRWDRFHAGHFLTFGRLGKQYDLVKLVLLDHPEQEYSIAYRKQLLEEATSHLKGNFEVHVNKTHFGKITNEELDAFRPFDVYGAGNHEVLLHIESLGYPTVWVERSYDFDATSDRQMKRIKDALL